MRINKFLASCNLGSRRKVEELITAGKIKINNVVVTNLSTEVQSGAEVKYNDKIVTLTQKMVYLMLNKPKNFITAVSDDRGRNTVLDLVSGFKERIYPVGRLDYDTEGMLILTNDGDFANKLIHPSKNINKKYEVIVNKIPTYVQLDRISKGIEIDGYITKPAKIENTKNLPNGQFGFDLTIFEGRNRQIRKMVAKLGLNVVYLKRVQIGKLCLGNLPVGKYKHLSKPELNLLLKFGG